MPRIHLPMDFEKQQPEKIQKKLLITGCGRSGTLYASRLWRSLGLDIRHEQPIPPNGMMGANGIASWFMVVDDPQPPSGPSAVDYEFEVVLHQTRHPLKVIPSVAQFILGKGKRAPRFIERHVPETVLRREEKDDLDSRQQLLLKASRYWVRWNLWAEKRAHRSVKLEDLESELPRLCDLVGVRFRSEVLDDIPKNVNARRLLFQEEPWTCVWEDIKQMDSALYEDIRELASRYGYDE